MDNRFQLSSGPVVELAPSAPGGYSYLVPYPVAMLPPGYVDQMMALGQQVIAANMVNERLLNQLRQKQLAEEAYSRSIAVADNCICTIGKSGALLPILDCTVRWSVYTVSLPPLRGKPLYVVCLSKSEQPIRLLEEEFFNDNKLISKLQGEGRATVTIRKSIKWTALLLRQAIERNMKIFPVSNYAGWIGQGEVDYSFTAFPHFSAHRRDEMSMPFALRPTSPAVTELAIQRWLPAFSSLQDCFTRWFVWMWFHVAFLYSLLDALGFRPPLGLYLFCDLPNYVAYLQRLFCWYEDPELSMDMPSALFCDKLLDRKDQALVIVDSCGTKNAKQNVVVVEEMLSSYSLPWKNGRDGKHLPVQALPTILSTAVSDLVCNLNLIVLEVTDGQLSPNFPPREYLEEYLTALANYTGEHIEKLRESLEEASGEVWTLADSALTESCVVMLGIFLGLQRFLRNYYTAYGATMPLSDAMILQLRDVLRETSDKIELSGCLAGQFIAVARHMIQHGQLEVWQLSEHRAAPKDTAAVYIDEENLRFSQKAMKQTCQQLNCSRPMVLRSLADMGLMQGRPINGSTFLTRVQLYNVYGATETVSVYCMQKAAFEKLGDPLRMMEGDDPQL